MLRKIFSSLFFSGTFQTLGFSDKQQQGRGVWIQVGLYSAKADVFPIIKLSRTVKSIIFIPFLFWQDCRDERSNMLLEGLIPFQILSFFSLLTLKAAQVTWLVSLVCTGFFPPCTEKCISSCKDRQTESQKAASPWKRPLHNTRWIRSRR